MKLIRLLTLPLALFAAASASLAQQTVLRVGHFPNITHAQGLVASQLSREGKGWFEPRLGGDVKIQWFVYNAGPSAMEALAANSIDLTYVGPNPALKLDGFFLDDADAERKGEWLPGSLTESRRIGTGYVHDGNAHKGECSMRWTPDIPEPGEYEIILHFPPNPNRATNAPVTIESPAAPAKTVQVNEQDKSGRATLGTFKLPRGKGTAITLTNQDTNGHVVADGVQLLKR